MRAVFCALAMLAAGCETAGNVTREQVALINPGMTAEAVTTALGAPGDRTFRANAEAWQYCRDGFYSDDYRTVWLVDGVVVAMTNRRLSAEGPCASYYERIDWGQAPPDVRIRLEGQGDWLPEAK